MINKRQSHVIPLQTLATIPAKPKSKLTQPRNITPLRDLTNVREMSSNARQPLLTNKRVQNPQGRNAGFPARLCTSDEENAFHEFSSSLSADGNSGRRQRRGCESPTVVLTQEQVESLIQTLEITGNTLKQLTYRGDYLIRPRRPRIPRWIVSYLLLITAVWQVLGIVALTILKAFTEHRKDERSTFILTIAILVLFQSVNLLLVFITSVKLTKQFMHHTVTKSFLGQSYVSMTLLYAGLYTLVYNIQHDSFGKSSELHIPDTVFSSWILFARMLYYSISTATLCGVGHITAVSWYAQLISATQMLMSYVYFASVLSIAVHPPKKIQYTIGGRDANVNSPKTYGTIQQV